MVRPERKKRLTLPGNATILFGDEDATPVATARDADPIFFHRKSLRSLDTAKKSFGNIWRAQ
jgi:hypothetical protein